MERLIKTHIDPEAPVLQWMVMHAVETINRFLVGADGRTSWYRLYNKHFIGKVIEFGELVFAKPLRKTFERGHSKAESYQAFGWEWTPRLERTEFCCSMEGLL